MRSLRRMRWKVRKRMVMICEELGVWVGCQGWCECLLVLEWSEARTREQPFPVYEKICIAD